MVTLAPGACVGAFAEVTVVNVIRHVQGHVVLFNKLSGILACVTVEERHHSDVNTMHMLQCFGYLHRLKYTYYDIANMLS